MHVAHVELAARATGDPSMMQRTEDQARLDSKRDATSGETRLPCFRACVYAFVRAIVLRM